MTGEFVLALTAGMLGAVNPCGFAILPAYLSLLISTEAGGAVRRALRCSVALTTGYVVVFGAFGLVLTPVAGWLTPRLPWLTVVLGLGLAALGCWLLSGRSLPTTVALRAPVLTGSAWSMVLFGMAYAIASLGCAIGPFLALVVSSLRAGSVGSGLLMFLAYAAGMGLVITVTAVAVALVRLSLIARARRVLSVVPRLGGAVLLIAGLYLAYYGRYELRLAVDLRRSGHDPLVNAATEVQQRLATLVDGIGAGWLTVVLAALAGATALRARRRRRAPSAPADPAGDDLAPVAARP